MKRYTEYKDSGVPWIGEIPKDWEIIKIKYLCNIKRGASPRPIDDPKYFDENGDRYWVRISDITNSNKYLERCEQTLSPEGIKNSVKINEDDFFVSICASVGKPCISKVKACIHDGFVLFEKLDKNLNEYMYFLFETKLPFAGLGKMGTQLNLNSETIGNIYIPIHQNVTNITNYLNAKTAAIDTLISDKQKMIDLLKEKRQAIISETVTKGLDKNAKMKDSGIEWIGEIPEHWKRTKLKNLLSIPITDGPHETPEILDEGIPFISAEAIKNLKIDFNLKRGYISIDNHLKFCKKCKPQYGDIFMVKSGATTGNVAMVETYDEFSIWSPLALIRNNTNIINNKYLFYCLQSRPFRLQVELFWNFGTQQNIGMGVLGNLYLSYPEIDVQIDIVSYLNTKTSEIDNLVNDITEQIEKLKEYRQAIISEAVTGKVAI